MRRRLGLRARFALIAAALVLLISALAGAGGYLALRAALLSRAEREARDQARQLAGLVETGAAREAEGNRSTSATRP